MKKLFRRQHSKVEVALLEMNVADLYSMLDNEQLDFLLGVTDLYTGSWNICYLYREPLLYIPRLATPETNPSA
ncbi:hypothetical protein ACO0LF_31245 [Undibacterium sp. Di27W]|uniref:hypothetical protein n=1 Tax=Undibacterium sp. Di27W TaxID=3413036 RepID=UPI003BEF87CC